MSSDKEKLKPASVSTAKVVAQRTTMSPRKVDRRANENNLRFLRSLNLAKTVYRLLRDSRLHYLEDDDLERFGITRTDLDFSSGKPSKGSEQFVDPIAPEVIEEWLRMAHGSEDDMSPPSPDRSTSYDNQLDAYSLCILITRYLDEAADKAGDGPSILNTHTLWTNILLV